MPQWPFLCGAPHGRAKDENCNPNATSRKREGKGAESRIGSGACPVKKKEGGVPSFYVLCKRKERQVRAGKEQGTAQCPFFDALLMGFSINSVR